MRWRICENNVVKLAKKMPKNVNLAQESSFYKCVGPTKNLYPESKQEFLPVIASADVTESIIAQS